MDEAIEEIEKRISNSIKDEDKKRELLGIIKEAEAINPKDFEGQLPIVFKKDELKGFDEIRKEWKNNIILTPEEAAKFFEFVIKAYGLPMGVEVDPNVSSVYDGPD